MNELNELLRSSMNPLEMDYYYCDKCEKRTPMFIDGGPYEVGGHSICYCCKEEFEEGFGKEDA